MPQPRQSSAHSQAGFTIIETMVACVLLLVGMVATLTIVEQASSTTNKTRTREQGTNLQRELIEAARSVSYDALTPNGIVAAVSARPALADFSGAAGWTIKRRNATYTVSMGVCSVDDPRDGIGAEHAAGMFCNGPPPTPEQCATLISAQASGTLASVAAAAGVSVGRCGIDANLDGTVDDLVSASLTVCSPCTTPADPNPADYKRVVSLVRWPGGYNLQTSQINNPGPAAAPAVTDLTPLPSPPAPPNTVNTGPSLDFTATTKKSPKTVQLYRDGTAIGALPGSANSWAGPWNLGPVTGPPSVLVPQPQPATTETVDGSYQISAKAFDQYGQYGATRSQTIKVNRRQHFAPARVVAGRNGNGVEIEWSPAKEHDSEGFRVYRRENVTSLTGILTTGDWTEVCGGELKVRTACRDDGAPAVAALKTLEYSVVGYDRYPVTVTTVVPGLRAGDRSAAMAVDDSILSTVPGTPSALAASLVDGNVVLTWTAPSDVIAPDHYNIYRGGQAYDNRVGSVYIAPGQALTYTDTRTPSPVPKYWVTAVNSKLRESAQLGVQP